MGKAVKALAPIAIGAWLGPMAGKALYGAAFGASAATAASIAGVGFKWTAAKALGSMLVSGLVSKAMASDTPDMSYEAAGITVNKAANDAPIPVVYGLRRVGGTRVLLELTGGSNEYLHVVLALAEGEIESVENIYLTDVLSTDSKFSGKLNTYTHTGADDQAADANLVSAVTGWTTDHKLSGTAYLYLRLKYDSNTYPGGIPQITADVKGVKVYDPRTSTKAWSDNPALCIRDYLTNTRYGRGIDSGLIDDDSFIAAANYCEGQVTIGGVTKDRYTLNGVVDTSVGSMDVLKRMLTSCRGMLIFSAGKYKLLIDKPEVAAFTFDEDNITGEWSISLGDKSTRFNRIRANFFNPDRDWQPDLAVVDSPALRTDDNGLLLEKTIDLPFTSDIDRAKMITTINLNQSRQSITCEFGATIDGLRCEVGDVVYIKHTTPGWDTLNSNQGKLFRIMRLTLQNNDEVRVLALEYDATAYDFGTIAASDAAPNTNLPDPYTVGKVSDLRFSVEQYVNSGEMTVNWDSTGISFIDYYDVIIDGVAGRESVTRNSVTSTTPNTVTSANIAYQFAVVRNTGFHAPLYDVVTTLSPSERADLSVNQSIIMSGWTGSNSTYFNSDNGEIWKIYEITDNADGTTTLRIYSVSLRQEMTSMPTSSSLTIYTENLWAARANPASYYRREIRTDDEFVAVSDLSDGLYEVSVTPVNTLGVRGTTTTIGVQLDQPPVPNVSGLELDLGGGGQANSTEWTGRECKIKWRASGIGGDFETMNDEDPQGAEFGSIDPYVKDYQVDVYNGSTLLRTEYVTDTWYAYTYEKNFEDAAKNSTTPYRELAFHVRARGKQNQVSATPAIL